ncbi:MAG: type II toxin-antitoxin system prevent-host-death family antitoxin [Desulfobacterales bacterium]|jgi:prevent-host-death family protein
MFATAKDLRFHSKNLLDAVSRGEEVIITYRGKPCAKMVPIEEKRVSKEKKDDLFGIWKDHNLKMDIEAYIRNLRKSRF